MCQPSMINVCIVVVVVGLDFFLDGFRCGLDTYKIQTPRVQWESTQQITHIQPPPKITTRKKQSDEGGGA